MIIGIDPGQTGGVAELTAVTGTVAALFPMPSISDFASWISSRRDSHVFIEKAQCMPKQGISSAFHYGCHFGELLGVLVAYLIPHTLVPPRTWARVMHTGTKDATTKERSVEATQRLFPSVELRVGKAKKPHLGITEALLIAEYGRRSLSS